MSIERLQPARIVSSLNITPVDLSRIVEGVDNDDGLWLSHNNPLLNVTANIAVAFQAPSDSLRPGAGLQKIRTRVRAPSAPPGIPVDIILNEGGEFVALLGEGIVTEVSGQVLEASFDAAMLADTKGRAIEVAVQLRRAQDGINFEGGDIGAIELLLDTEAQAWSEEPELDTVWKAA